MNSSLVEVSSEAVFIAKCASWLESVIAQSVNKHDYCCLGLSGGSTPKPILNSLFEKQLPWDKLFFFLIDERRVSSENPDANAHLLNSTILRARSEDWKKHHVCFPDTTLPHLQCVEDYGTRLRQFLTAHPCFSITLGIGPDGHIASLFPPLSRELLQSTEWTAATRTERFAVHERITVTPHVLLRAEHVAVFVKGGDKKEKIEASLAPNADPRDCPLSPVIAHAKDYQDLKLFLFYN
eukprot:GCRY01002298.1.p1 GENE.GCRY01002298.1~~GCRY01002298.1.p1  ORF type:complete len:238 (-),score=47.82 GCRY01002298.1:462-1175(-)